MNKTKRLEISLKELIEKEGVACLLFPMEDHCIGWNNRCRFGLIYSILKPVYR
jgi:hypothetical protein